MSKAKRNLKRSYDAVDGKMVVNEYRAEVVRIIFAEILSGKSTCLIADDLNRRNVPSRNGGRWTATTIRGIVDIKKTPGMPFFRK